MSMMTTTTSSLKCICNRHCQFSKIICMKCSTDFEGCIYHPCSIHPNKIPLMNHVKCINQNCQSIRLIELPFLILQHKKQSTATSITATSIVLGPPPGFECITSLQTQTKSRMRRSVELVVEYIPPDVLGPPPGFECITSLQPQPKSRMRLRRPRRKPGLVIPIEETSNLNVTSTSRSNTSTSTSHQ